MDGGEARRGGERRGGTRGWIHCSAGSSCNGGSRVLSHLRREGERERKEGRGKERERERGRVRGRVNGE